MSRATKSFDATQLHNGILLMTIGTSIVPVMDAVAKHLGDTMSPIQITWGRFLFQTLIMAIALMITNFHNDAFKPIDDIVF